MALTGDLKLVALTGIPNVGKTTIFNKLTGLNQKVGNYPGITVDKKIGRFSGSESPINIVDLPGTYNIYPRSEDELIVFRVLCGLEKKVSPDAVLIIADSTNLERSLFFATQLIDLQVPAALVLNMEDSARKSGLSVNNILLSRLLGVPVISTTAKSKEGIFPLRELINAKDFRIGRPIVDVTRLVNKELLEEVKSLSGFTSDYQALQMLKFLGTKNKFSVEENRKLQELTDRYNFNGTNSQRDETKLRYEKVQEILKKSVRREKVKPSKINQNLDKVFLNKSFGLLIFAVILFVVFQAIFTWAEAPMDWIDQSFSWLSGMVTDTFPEGALTSLLAEGIIPGVGGIVIFIPQISLLFGFLALLESTGYMSRAVFITDRLVRPFGLNGRSVVPLISGMACAIPAIMATRTISNAKDKLITIFVTPLMSCSARLPVYIILIGIVIPEENVGPFSLQGIALFGMYLLGLTAALFSAGIMKLLLHETSGGHLVIELPRYRFPHWKNVFLTMYEKAKTFVLEAGKIILAISVVLWVLASYGPGDEVERASTSVQVPEEQTEKNMQAYQKVVASRELEASYAGHIGRFIEPVIAPLGYDWKIGIALITSFAAREVFVSTIATLYSIGDDSEDYTTIQEKLKSEVNPDTGEPFFTLAVGASLLVFYAFAMQCMSTIAVVYRETKSWKWPLIQTVYMTFLAYFSSLLVYQILS